MNTEQLNLRKNIFSTSGTPKIIFRWPPELIFDRVLDMDDNYRISKKKFFPPRSWKIPGVTPRSQGVTWRPKNRVFSLGASMTDQACRKRAKT